jgi:hypothetical protein
VTQVPGIKLPPILVHLMWMKKEFQPHTPAQTFSM